MSSPRSDALGGAIIALLEARMSGEIGELVRRYGGSPRFAPAVREAPLDCRAPVAAFLRSLEAPADRVAVFLTGVGATALFDEADRQGQMPFLSSVLSRAITVCRGPKPTAALKRRGLQPTFVAGEPFTSAEVLGALEHLDLAACEVALIHYGERNDALASALKARGARLNELCLYEWQMPADVQPLRGLVADVIAGTIDAVVFTSQIQCRHLLQSAAEAGLADELVRALNDKTVVACVGPVCRAAVEASGITPDVVPTTPKMVPLIAALAQHFRTREINRQATGQ